MTIQSISTILFAMLILLVGFIVLGSVSRRYRKDLGLKKEEQEKTQETAFIINAFHEVTKQLKEKEKELERLRSLAEQRADNVESYTENILQCVTSGVITFDGNCKMTTINRAAEEILGSSRALKEGMSCFELFGEGEITKAVHQTMQTKSPSARLEAMLELSKGKVWLGFNTAVLTDRKGEALGVILSFSDLTEVKRLQEQVELRERLTALGEMSAGIAHELRNPMAVISGYLKLLSKKTNDKNHSIIRDISAEIDGMNRIIGDLLMFARPASLNRIKVNMKDLIDGCLAAVLQATGADTRITANVNVDGGDLIADEVLLRQAFSNLFQNAIESIPEKGSLSIRGHQNGSFVVTVSDTGTGIPKDTIKKIFLPFFTTKDKGVGLGLALVHKIILSHGGRIEVKSQEGKGTTFTVLLPKG